MAAYDDVELWQPTDMEVQTKAVIKNSVELATTEQPTAAPTLVGIQVEQTPKS